MDRPLVVERTTCRVCGGPFDPVLNLGSPVLNDFVEPTAPDPPRVPLDLVVCQRCELVQLRHTVDRDALYRTYWYRSGVNEAMRAELTDIARMIADYQPKGTILDIGANDGTLLTNFDGDRWTRVGVEPARNITPLLCAAAWFNDFFPKATADLPARCCDVITSIACFYDLDDPRSFVAEVDRLLTRNGIWVVQFQDLAQTIRTNAFDYIGHEHLCFYSAETFSALLEPFDLEIVYIEKRAINGGSLRFVVQRRWADRRWVAKNPIPLDMPAPVSGDELDHFAWRIGQYRDQLVAAIDQVRDQGYVVDLYAASTKSSTLLQYCGIDASRIRCAVERSPEKVGLVTSGSRIPIIAEADWRVDPAPVTLLGAWQFREQFVQREADYLARGGAFLIPLPRVEVVVHGTH